MIIRKVEYGYYIDSEKGRIYFDKATRGKVTLFLYMIDGEYIGYIDKDAIDNWNDVEKWFPNIFEEDE